MKILNDLRVNPDQTDALQKQKATAEKFGEILAQEINQAQGVVSESSEIARQHTIASGVGLLGVPTAQATEAASLSLQETSLQVEGLFADLENYAATLRSQSSNSLRNAYATLQGVSDNIARLKATSPGLDASPELATLVNELDVLATTEMFKFNRGDYL